MRSASFALSIVTALALSGCVTPQLYTLEPVAATSQHQLKVVDERPAIEKTSEILSLMVTNEAYGIFRMGDDTTNPDRITYLKSILANIAGDKIGSTPVVVKTFTIHRNNQALMRGSNVGRASGITGAVLASMETRAEKRQPGGYEIMENPKELNAVVIDIVVSIGGKEYSSRAVHAVPGTAVRYNSDPKLWQVAVNSSLRSALTHLANNINQS